MFRIAKEDDFERLQEIYSQSVQQLAPSLYSPEQVIAWSSSPKNTEKFRQFIFTANTYLSLENDVIIGFCGLESNGHITSFYFHPDYTRQGYGSKLLSYVLKQGIKQRIDRFFTEASFFSFPVFSRFGFTVIEMETVLYGDVFFERYKMEKVVERESQS